MYRDTAAVMEHNISSFIFFAFNTCDTFQLFYLLTHIYVKVISCIVSEFTFNICDWLWKKGHIRAYFQNRVIGTAGLSKLSAIKCTTRFVVKVTCCGVMAESVHSFLFTQRSNSSRKR